MSAQSQHNPAPDLGPEPSTPAIIQWMRDITATLKEIDQRIKRLEVSDMVPMLFDLSARLEALEEGLAKHDELFFRSKYLDRNQ